MCSGLHSRHGNLRQSCRFCSWCRFVLLFVHYTQHCSSTANLLCWSCLTPSRNIILDWLRLLTYFGAPFNGTMIKTDHRMTNLRLRSAAPSLSKQTWWWIYAFRCSGATPTIGRRAQLQNPCQRRQETFVISAVNRAINIHRRTGKV